MEKIIIDLEVKSNKGIKEVNALNKSLDKTNENQKKVKKSTEDVSKATKKASSTSQRNAAAFEAVNKATGGAIRGFRALIKQMWLLVANPIGAVVAGLVLGLSALYKAFSSTKAGGEELKQVMAGISAVVDVVRDRVLKVGDALIKFFTGDFKGALKSGRESVSGFGAEVAKEFKQASNSVKALQEVTDAVRGLSVSRAELNRDLIQAKEIIEGETASYAEKKKAIEEVRIAETKQTEDELANAKKKLDAIVLANSLSDSGDVDLDKEAQARIAVINLEAISSSNKTKFNKLEKLAQSQELSRIKEIAAEKKKEVDDSAANEKKKAADKKAIEAKYNADKKAIEAKYNADIKAIRELEANTEEEKRVLALEKEKEKFDAAILLATEQGLSTEELERSQKESLKLMRDGFAQTDLDRATKKAADEKIIKDKSVSDEIELEAKRVASKHQALNDISSIFGAESAMGRAALIAKQLMAAQELLIDLGAIKSKATKAVVGSQLNAVESGGAVATGFSKTLALGFPAAIPALIGYAASAAGIISGVMAATKKTKSVASSLGGSGGGGGGSPSAPSIPSVPPAFNVVGASGTSQLADAIGGQSQQPTRAYVVSDDVTSAQSMDRNIIDGASI